MKIKKYKIRYCWKPGDVRERTKFAFLPIVILGSPIWFKFYHITEILTKDVTTDEFQWEIISLQY